MAKTEIPYSRFLPQVLQRMRDGGLLLVSVGADGIANAMTVGWGAFGPLWARPTVTLQVRRSRYTWSRLEEVGEFTVNVPPPALGDACYYCGNVSGRDEDKLARLQLAVSPGRQVRAPVLDDCILHFECRVLYKSDVDLGALAQSVRDSVYGSDDLHRTYVGEIVACYGDVDALDAIGAP